MMDFNRNSNPNDETKLEAQSWAPPECPLDMPMQVLERRKVRRSWLRLPSILTANDA
ncbi:hypothetical protein [Tropicimonas sp. IMCC34043]|uniref:hypothetical protein n=1 Tax=Tropicimonas sp. IMCC34043 TaxID=2248760 RepID=UPI0013008BB4|nr:hypothetical protein [Tropicimonas sp. IMCC34043]